MLADIIFYSIMGAIVLGIIIVDLYDIVFKCNHKWEQIHDTKYDNVGFRDKYPIILVCSKCGKVKVIK